MDPSEMQKDYDAGRRDFSGEDLARVDLRGANLSYAKLRGANLHKANLRWANLAGADLSSANLTGADLWGANLIRANLESTNFHGAKLTGTILDHTAPLPKLSDDKIRMAGLEPDRDGVRVWGWRTRCSAYIGDTVYTPRRAAYKAPVLSRDTSTECHPGIYLGSQRWAEGIVGQRGTGIVRCYCRRDELVVVSKGGRCRRLWVPVSAQTKRTP